MPAQSSILTNDTASARMPDWVSNRAESHRRDYLDVSGATKTPTNDTSEGCRLLSNLS